VIRLVRTGYKTDERQWDPESPDPGLLAGVERSSPRGRVDRGRFTDDHGAAIRDSRIRADAPVAELMPNRATGPRC